MSKKKNKFKKKKHQQAQNSPASHQVARINNVDGQSLEDSSNLSTSVTSREEIPEEKPDFYKTDKYEHVKVDIKKILFIMAIIILVLIGIYVLSLKTTILDSFGNWIYKILNIQVS